MNDSSTQAAMTFISPFFIVRDVAPSIAFYRDLLGFQLAFLATEDDPFFAIFRRDGVQVMVKAVDVPPLPNSQRHASTRWDAFVHTPDPDALASEFTARGVTLHTPLADTDDPLRGFELQDPDGYVLFFGRPI